MKGSVTPFFGATSSQHMSKSACVMTLLSTKTLIRAGRLPSSTNPVAGCGAFELLATLVLLLLAGEAAGAEGFGIGISASTGVSLSEKLLALLSICFSAF